MILRFLWDCASPNVYLAHRALPAIAARTGRAFAYVPVLLGGLFKATGNQSPMMANANIPAKMAYEMLELRRFIARHGLSRFAMNPHFPVNTLLAMRAAAAAEIDGQIEPFAEAVLAAMWEQGADLANPAALEAALNAAGLDGPRLLARAADQDVRDRLVANTQSAVEAGAFGLPSFLVGGDLYFGKNSQREVEEAIAEH